jgi:lipopolysaccharide heptosyltransferase II
MVIEWQNARKILVVRLRSIGDTVLATPALIALRQFLPKAQIDILLEDWVAPILEGFDAVDNILTFPKKSKRARLQVARKIRHNNYDVAFDLHGGTTATFFIRASGARYRIGFSNYRLSFFYTHLLSSASDFWQKDFTHSAEQQLALLGFVGVPVENPPKSRLNVTKKARNSIEEKLNSKLRTLNPKIALLHPVAAFETKQWATENFAQVADYLNAKGWQVVAVATPKERKILENLKQCSVAPVLTFDELTLPEVTALAAKAEIFVGNDSGIAHIAAAVGTPSVVVFGSSNINHWRPWTDAPNEIVYEKFSCQPCAGYFCKEFDKPKCILSIKTESVIEAIEKLLSEKKRIRNFSKSD